MSTTSPDTVYTSVPYVISKASNNQRGNTENDQTGHVRAFRFAMGSRAPCLLAKSKSEHGMKISPRLVVNYQETEYSYQARRLYLAKHSTTSSPVRRQILAY